MNMLFYAVILLCLLATPINLFGQTRTPTDTVRNMLNEVMAVQSSPALQGQEHRASRKTEIKKIMLRNFNFDDMARQTLGPQWLQLSDAQHKEFKSVFQDLFLDSYSRLVLDFLKRETIAYTGENLTQGQSVVNTIIKRPNEEISVDYTLIGPSGKSQVRDVRIDGVSIVGNYQKTFSRIIRQESYEGLLKKMKLQQRVIEEKE